MKVARPVLRGPRRSNALGLPDRVSHSFPAISAVFDDPNLVSCAGLAPAMALAQRFGLTNLVADTLTLKAEGGVNAHLKVPALVAGMVAGADSIDDMDLLRHGGMGRLFTGVRAPSTLGTFLRTDDPQATLLTQVQGVIAEYEKAKIAERYRRGKLFRARAGEITTWKASYGYRHVSRSAANQEIARRCEVDSDAVRRWRARFAQKGADGVGVIAKGRGRKPALPEGTVAEIVRHLPRRPR